jgi:peptidoglycan/xylan/chitin deacetylase (PgdA/CDA1 family)
MSPTPSPFYFSLTSFSEAATPGLPILMYHQIARPSLRRGNRGLCVSPGLFQAQIQELAFAGYTSASLDALPLADSTRRIVLTFDDGFRNVLANALPILGRHRWQAIQFLVADRQVNAWDVPPGGKSVPLMSDSEVREWLAAGQQIGAHTLTHPHLTQLSLAQAREEIFSSRKSLEDRFQVPIEHFCYPYGDQNSEIRALVEAAGYKTACSTIPGLNTAGTDPLRLHRHMASHRRPAWAAAFRFLPAHWW